MNFKNLATGAALALGVALLGLPAANANVILTYTGNDFTIFFPPLGFPAQPYTGTDKVTASITLANPLGDNLNLADVTPLAFSLNDGVQTLSPPTPFSSTVFEFSTNASGIITAWDVKVIESTIVAITTIDIPVMFVEEDSGFTLGLGGGVLAVEATEFGSPGAWISTIKAGVPEPSTISVLGVGLLGLDLLWWRRRQKLDLAQ